MKRSLTGLLIAITGSFPLVGCYTQRHTATTQWEYKVALFAQHPNDKPAVWAPGKQRLLNEIAKEGWVFIQEDASGNLIFKRPMK